MISASFKVVVDKPNIGRVERAIAWFLENAYESAKDNRITWRISLSSQLAKEILVLYVDVSPDIPESTKRIATMKAIQRFFKYKTYRESTNPVRLYTRSLSIELARLNRKIRDFWVVMFVNLDRVSSELIGDQRIHGVDFEFWKWKNISRFDIGNMWDQTQYQLPASPLRKKISHDRSYTNQKDFCPLVSVHRTYDHGGAVSEAVRKVDLLRSAINLPRTSSFTIQLRSRPEPLSHLGPSPIYGIFNNEGRFETAYFTGYSHSYKRVKIREDEIPSFSRIIEVLNSAPQSSYCQHVVDAMELYQSALDTDRPQQAFLRFWQTLEVASAPDLRNPRQDLVKSRINGILNLQPRYLDALEMLTKLRNSLVHSGSFPDREDDILFALKPFADATMCRLIEYADRFNSLSEFQEYLSHMTLSDSTLDRRRRVIDGILDDRH